MKVEFACTLRARLRGMLGRVALDGALLLAPCHDVHTFGMREPLDIAFVTADGMVLESHRAIGPRRRICCRGAAATLERFAEETPWLEPGDRIELEWRNQ